jgi:hypothetical protein
MGVGRACGEKTIGVVYAGVVQPAELGVRGDATHEQSARYQ